MTDWITNRPPTEADADKFGNVIICITPRLCKDLSRFEKWHDITLGWPWRHTSLWTPQAPAPEPTPAAPEFKVGQVWRNRDGQTSRIIWIEDGDTKFPIMTNLICTDLKGGYWHWSNGKSCLSDGDQDHERDLVELISDNPPQPEPVVTALTPAAPEPEPEKATRGFLAFSRVEYSNGFVDSAVGTDRTAWVRHSTTFTHWEQVSPLPQPGEE